MIETENERKTKLKKETIITAGKAKQSHER
jgi:hypothetical protein